MDARLQRLTAYGAVLMTVLLFFGMAGIAGFIPPPSPSASAQQILQRYTEDSMRIRLGMAVMLFAAVLSFPLVISIGMLIARIEGTWGLLAITQVTAGVVAMPIPLTFVPTIIMSMTFRPNARSADTLLAFSDFFWLAFLAPAGPAMLQAATIAIAALSDRSTPEVVPRWVGYFNIWCTVLYVPAVAMFFFREGPLAWDGIIAFWLPTVAFGLWVLVMAWTLLRAVRQRAAPPTSVRSSHLEQMAHPVSGHSASIALMAGDVT